MEQGADWLSLLTPVKGGNGPRLSDAEIDTPIAHVPGRFAAVAQMKPAKRKAAATSTTGETNIDETNTEKLKRQGPTFGLKPGDFKLPPQPAGTGTNTVAETIETSTETTTPSIEKSTETTIETPTNGIDKHR
jgi:hypothetical protein